MHNVIEFRGSFQFRDQAAIDIALCDAADHLDDSDLAEVDRDWLRYLSRNGLTMHVEAVLPETADRFVAAAILGALARQAYAGRVHVTRLNHRLDTFEPEPESDEDVA